MLLESPLGSFAFAHHGNSRAERCQDVKRRKMSLTHDKPLEGIWYDRSLKYDADRRGKDLDDETFIARYTLKLDPPSTPHP